MPAGSPFPCLKLRDKKLRCLPTLRHHVFRYVKEQTNNNNYKCAQSTVDEDASKHQTHELNRLIFKYHNNYQEELNEIESSEEVISCSNH